MTAAPFRDGPPLWDGHAGERIAAILCEAAWVGASSGSDRSAQVP